MPRSKCRVMLVPSAAGNRVFSITGYRSAVSFGKPHLKLAAVLAHGPSALHHLLALPALAVAQVCEQALHPERLARLCVACRRTDVTGNQGTGKVRVCSWISWCWCHSSHATC